MVLDRTLIGALVVLLFGLIIFVFITWSNTKGARKQTDNIFQQQRLVRTSPDAHRLSQAVHLLRPSVRLGFDYVITQAALYIGMGYWRVDADTGGN